MNGISYVEKSRIWLFYKIFLFFTLLVSFRAWFLWGVNNNLTALLSIIIGCFVYALKPMWFENRIHLFWLGLLFICFIFGNLAYGLPAVITRILIGSPLLFIFLLNNNYKEDLLHSLQKYLFVVVFISVIGWIIHLVGIPTPYTILSLGTAEDNGEQYLFENHYIFLVGIRTLDSLLLPRLSSIFPEPGYFGCLMALNLYIGKYKINKENVVFFLGLFLSFSLAAFILLILGILFCFGVEIKKGRNGVIVAAVLLTGVYIWAKNANNGNNMVNEAILSRLEYDSSRGTISGYNRSQTTNDQWFWNSFIYDDDLWLGKVNNKLDSNAVDWKSYIIIHGFISFVFWVLYLLYPSFLRGNRRRCLFLSLLYFFIFAQAMPMSQSMMYLTFYTLGINRIKRIELIKEK